MAEAVDGLQDLALTWSGRAFDVSRIESELGKLRYLAAGEPACGEGFAIRASILNMVVYAEHEDGANNASRVIEDLASHHPSRAIIVVARPSDDASHIEAQLAAHCHINTDLEHQVCCEEVTLHVSGRSASHLHSVIIPLLVPDLPVYVWWTEHLPEGSHVLTSLMETSDRFIVDSERFADQAADLLRLARLGDEQPGTTLGDLNWTGCCRGANCSRANARSPTSVTTSLPWRASNYATHLAAERPPWRSPSSSSRGSQTSSAGTRAPSPPRAPSTWLFAATDASSRCT